MLFSKSHPRISSEESLHTSTALGKGLDPRSERYSTELVDRVLSAAMAAGASDIHWDVCEKKINVRWRVDGRLIAVDTFDLGTSSSVAARLKSMSGLLSYRSDIPQEGRFKLVDHALEARVGTLPTLYGERIVVRLAKPQSSDWRLVDLQFPDEACRRFNRALRMPSGVILITGPSGSGKTTTGYAVLREIQSVSIESPRVMVSLEDPVEQTIAGVAQSQVQPSVGYTWTSGLKALLRQDPEVLYVGEIRDSETAHVVFQAALVGQLVITTMHARSTADALRRLIDMRVPTQHLLGGLSLLSCQRLMRRDTLSESSRVPIVEIFPSWDEHLTRLLVQEADSLSIYEAAIARGMASLRQQAQRGREAGILRAEEIERHFGQEDS